MIKNYLINKFIIKIIFDLKFQYHHNSNFKLIKVIIHLLKITL